MVRELATLITLSTSLSQYLLTCLTLAVITPFLVNTDKANLGPKVFFLWGSLCIFSTLFAYFLVPELKGLSLEQADMCMAAVTPRNSAKWKPDHTFAAELHHTSDEKALASDAVKETA